MWRGVIDAVDRLTILPEHPPPPLMVGTAYQLQRQLRSALGVLKGVSASLSMDRPHDPVGLTELLNRLPHLLDLMHSPELWRADVAKKIRERELGL